MQPNPYWLTAGDALAGQMSPTAINPIPGECRRPIPFAGNLGDGVATTDAVFPFLLARAFAEHDSRPTAHEWLAVKRIERGWVAPFHSSEVRHV